MNTALQAEVATTAVAAGGTINIPVESGFGSFESVTATSSNTAVVANSGITLNSKDTSLAVTALSGATGSTTISLTSTPNDTNTGPYGDLFVGSVVSTFVLSILPEVTVGGLVGAANTFRIVRDGSNVDVYVNNTTGTPTTQYNYASYSAIAFAGQNAGNTFTVDYSGGDPVPIGGIVFTGSSGTDSLNVVGLSGTNAITLNSGSSVQINSDFINYTSVENMNLDLGSGTNTLASVSPTTLPTITLDEDAGGATTIGGASGTLPSHTILSIASGGTFSIAGAAESIDQVTGTGTLALGLLTIGAANGTSTFSGVMSGNVSSGLTKVGTGTFVLTGNDTFTGAVNIGNGATSGGDIDGILRIASSGALADASSLSLNENNSAYDLLQIDGTNGPVTISLPITIDANNVSGSYGVPATDVENIAGNDTIASPITFQVGGNGYGIQSDAGSLAFTDPLTLTHVLYMRGAGNGSFTNVLSGAGALTFQGTGNWTISNANTYTGATTVSSGRVTLANATAIPSSSTLSLASGATLGLQNNITISGRALTLSGGGLNSAGELLNVSGTNTWSGAITLSGSSVIIGATAAALTLSGAITGGALTVTGSGKVVLSAADSYTGSTSVTGGTLEIASTGSIASSSASISSGAIFTVDSGGSIPAGTTLTDNGTANFNNAAPTLAALNGSGAVNLAGSTVLTITTGGTFGGAIGGGGAVNLSGGTLTLNGINTYIGDTTVAAGATLIVNGALGSATNLTSNGSTQFAANGGTSGPAALSLDSITIGSGGFVGIGAAASSANRWVLIAGSLSFNASTGLLDLATNDLIIHNGNLAAITGQIAAAYNGGSWNGSGGITSSAAAASANTALGLELNNNGGGGVLMSAFDGQNVVSTDLLIKYTYFGDANLDGIVNGSDYTLIDNGFNNALAGWRNGDFNYDGLVNGDDYTLIDNAFNTQGPALTAMASEIIAIASPRTPVAAATFAPAVDRSTHSTPGNSFAAPPVARVFADAAPIWSQLIGDGNSVTDELLLQTR